MTDTSSSHPLPSTSESLQDLVNWARSTGHRTLELAEGDVLMREGDRNRSLFILLKGEVRLYKTAADGTRQAMDLLGPGSLIGILSFWTGKNSFSDSVAVSDAEILSIERREFEQAIASEPQFARLTLHLLVANLSDRYRRVVGLNLKVAGLTRELEQERNALQSAIQDLKQTRNQLIHREKLATMGQLLAGIAHEINNPSTALLKGVEQLDEVLPALLCTHPEDLRFFEAGRSARFMGSPQQRERMEQLSRRFPSLSRGHCRRLARFPEDMVEELAKEAEADPGLLDRAIRFFDLGSALQSIRVADERITRLVNGLKRYSRQDEESDLSVQLQPCVEDTLLVLNHRLKYYGLHIDIPETLPPLKIRAGELNQILTNLLSNACDATEPEHAISIRAGVEEVANRVWIEVEDEGGGIPENLLEKIFEPNVTTKSGGGQFGLGLGLAISRDLAMQVHGNLTARNRTGGGAVFRLELPAGCAGDGAEK